MLQPKKGGDGGDTFPNDDGGAGGLGDGGDGIEGNQSGVQGTGAGGAGGGGGAGRRSWRSWRSRRSPWRRRWRWWRRRRLLLAQYNTRQRASGGGGGGGGERGKNGTDGAVVAAGNQRAAGPGGGGHVMVGSRSGIVSLNGTLTVAGGTSMDENLLIDQIASGGILDVIGTYNPLSTGMLDGARLLVSTNTNGLYFSSTLSESQFALIGGGGGGGAGGDGRAVPEPATWAMLVVAAAGVSTQRRWRALPVSKLIRV